MGMKWTFGHKIFVAAVIAINIVVLAIPSDVAELVARDRQTLLGRYSREHFTWIVGLFFISIPAIYVHLSPNAQVKKVKAFRVTAIVLAFLLPTLVADVYLRVTREYRYVLEGVAYHRPLGAKFDGVFVDKPEAIRSYPMAPAGAPDVSWTLTADERGYRNLANLQTYDAIAVGDSFVEGSSVSDDQNWPVRLASTAGMSVYNLGMSGYAPQHSLAALQQVGFALKPKWVFFLFYEGNDFRTAKIKAKPRSKWGKLLKRSPIIGAIDEFWIKTLAPIRSDKHFAGEDQLSWMPVAVPLEGGTNYYAFSPSAMITHCVTKEKFVKHKYWRRTRHNLEQMRTVCQENGAKFVVVYAPSKPHVAMPLAREAMPADKLRTFAALRLKGDIPEAEEFKEQFFAHLDDQEEVVADWCGKNDVPFLSLTPLLADHMQRGEQVFFTYDEHWTPKGHEVVAAAIAEFWTALQAPVEPEAVAALPQ